MLIKRLKNLPAALIGFSCAVYKPWGLCADEAYLGCLFILHACLHVTDLSVKHTSSYGAVELLQYSLEITVYYLENHNLIN